MLSLNGFRLTRSGDVYRVTQGIHGGILNGVQAGQSAVETRAIPVTYLKHFLRNRDAFAFDQNNPNTGFRYLDPPARRNPDDPPAP